MFVEPVTFVSGPARTQLNQLIRSERSERTLVLFGSGTGKTA